LTTRSAERVQVRTGAGPGTRAARILIADDQVDVVEALRLLLKSEGYQIESATSPSQILQAAESSDLDIVLMDLNYTRDTTSGQEGLDLLKRLQALDSSLPVVVMTAWGSVDVAVEAMRRGARDFVQKPWDNARLLAIVRTQVELGRALRKGQRLEAENILLRGDGPPLLIADSQAMQPVLDLIERVGPSDANVLITGENGSGKGTVAGALHAVSSRPGKPLVTVNAGGLSEGLFESELFGHVKGAFTDAKSDRVGRFELSDGGTLFLDEIANIPLNLQPKLLRVLETGEFERVGSSKTRRVDVRIPRGLRRGGTASSDGALVARQRAGAGPRRGARRPDGSGRAYRDLRPRLAGQRVAGSARGHEPRRGRGLLDQEGARSVRRQRLASRGGAGAVAQRALQKAAALRAVAPGRASELRGRILEGDGKILAP